MYLALFGRMPQSIINFYTSHIVNGSTDNLDNYKEIVAVTGERMGQEGRQAFYKVFSDHRLIQNQIDIMMDSKTTLRNKINTLVCLDMYYRGYVESMQKGKGYFNIEEEDREQMQASAMECPITDKVLAEGLEDFLNIIRA